MQTIQRTRPVNQIGPKIRKPDAPRVVTSIPADERTEIFLLLFGADEMVVA